MADLLLVVLSLYLIQEGEAHRHAVPGVNFFVDFPGWALPFAYAAPVVLIPVLAAAVLEVGHRVPIRRWQWIGLGIAGGLLLVVMSAVGGPDAVWTIIDPSHR